MMNSIVSLRLEEMGPGDVYGIHTTDTWYEVHVVGSDREIRQVEAFVIGPTIPEAWHVYFCNLDAISIGAPMSFSLVEDTGITTAPRCVDTCPVTRIEIDRISLRNL